jgi:ParB-like chromosome segregation protein Spo0J
MKFSDIKLNPKNPRHIKDDRFRKLVQSIKDFPAMMELRPIVVNKDMMILGGNMRYRACKELGIKEIPDTWIKIAESLTEEEQRRFIIEDNIPFWEWDNRLGY